MATSLSHEDGAKAFSLPEAYALIRAALPSSSSPLSTSITAPPSLPHSTLPTTGLGDLPTLHHILQDLTPHFHTSKTSPNFYGFVTGGVLPIAEAADLVVGAWDQNVQVHWPELTGVASTVEWRAGGMLQELLGLEGEDEERSDDVEGRKGRWGRWGMALGETKGKGRWRARTFTTGATASNVLGLACAREAILQWHLDQAQDPNQSIPKVSVGELGLLQASRLANISEFQILTSMPHSSISKAASIIGFGRASIIDVGLASQPWRIDIRKLEERLARKGVGSMVVVGCGEVNSGRFATGNVEEMRRVRELCDLYGAWLHVDGAFGLFARVLPPGDEFDIVRKGTEGVELADSITGDCHKLLNVPYDCGFFLTHSTPLVESIFQNPNASYLSPSSVLYGENIPSPLNIGIENSRRFRALPVYAVLLSLGLTGLRDLFTRQVHLARSIAMFISQHAKYELLPQDNEIDLEERIRKVHIVILFRAVDPVVNEGLAERINHLKRIVVSGTRWMGAPAVRIAVSTWMVDGERDAKVVREVLEDVFL